jgi:hypothetical protein
MTDAEVLEAFREVTGWSDEQVAHYVSCGQCTAICGHEEEDCQGNPATIAWEAEQAERLRTHPRPAYATPPFGACYQLPSGSMVHVRAVCECKR